ncbi:hypothetical protein [Streptomyces sp. NPDC058953]|uniref:hypothetical protein n=1 Tax=Streptomyces sp. NPDC058953 TaxID=3346676 RepID=UPI0036894D98
MVPVPTRPVPRPTRRAVRRAALALTAAVALLVPLTACGDNDSGGSGESKSSGDGGKPPKAELTVLAAAAVDMQNRPL